MKKLLVSLIAIVILTPSFARAETIQDLKVQMVSVIKPIISEYRRELSGKLKITGKQG